MKFSVLPMWSGVNILCPKLILTSKKYRQRQYFEQRKQQQQAAGSKGYVDGKPSCSQNCENNRSLDILSLVNVSSRAHEHETCSLNGNLRYFRFVFLLARFSVILIF